MSEEDVLVLLQTSAAAGQANLIRQQEELERKAAELERKEQEMQNRSRASNTGGELLHEGMRTMCPHVGNSSVVCLQLRKTTGRLYRTSPPWSRASTRTLRRKSRRSTAGYAGGCITSGCVRTNSMDNAVNVSESNWSVSVSPVHSATLFLNVLACLAYFTADAAYAVDFGLSILWFILFTPVSFVCWYRPVYKAFRYTTS